MPCCLAMIREWQARRWIPPQVDSLLPVERECVHALNQAVVRNDWAQSLSPTAQGGGKIPRRCFAPTQLSQRSAFQPRMRRLLSRPAAKTKQNKKFSRDLFSEKRSSLPPCARLLFFNTWFSFVYQHRSLSVLSAPPQSRVKKKKKRSFCFAIHR